MKVLVLGASGFIGFPAAQALARAGHIVYGQTRSAQKAKQLSAEEIIPIVAEPVSPKWLNIVPTLDVIIEAIGGSAKIAFLSAEILQAVIDTVKSSRDPSAPKLTYIYTSGTWVHGDNRTDIVTDTSPLTNPVELVKWRPAHEQRVMKEPTLNGIVIRPSMLYGRSGSIFATLFGEAEKAKKEGRKLTFAGRPGGRFALVHADDLADLYVRVAEKAAICGGKAFDAANDFTESVDEILAVVAKVAGVEDGFAYREPANRKLYHSL
ncbi:NAD(P)-binding protein [Guyanagaster necrorhizus]|uniref:NAD(P)-binding protein n=1 Tax=Guyanagaster necrorhizus TaxID=856835 RepID=A0A9P8AQJ6_9AGAR|nr:NAD(P)-binding protein [Guyanagaster necrorhizus MCA 3950]KAG7444423.1 NAD(P)-binding protein [Guyanagaster necrorhizus MCA 3950]